MLPAVPRPRHGLEPCLVDRLAVDAAAAIRAFVDAPQRVAQLPQPAPIQLCLRQLLVVLVYRRMRKQRRRGGIGSAGAGSVYDWLNQDKRNAVEIVVEGRAEARDPEDKDGNLPDLAGARRRRP